jgi:outer membrane receptor protein involved in Fe transport
MLSRRNVLSLAAALASQLCIPGVAAAQTPADQPAAPADQPAAQPAAPAAQPAAEEGKKSVVEEIVVTGTRIRRKDLNTPAPVTVINRDQLTSSGKVSIGDFLQSLPEVGSNSNQQLNNAGDGSVRADLRTLGAPRTLVLVNGRRWVAGGTGANASVDLNSIPTAIVERIEILKDGASAVYGSDAIAGVVNIITRKNYQGTEVTAFAGGTTRSDGGTYDLSVTTGLTGEKGGALFSVGYSKTDPVFAGSRDFSKTQLAFNDFADPGSVSSSGSSRVPQGRIYGLVGGTQDGNAFFNSLVAGNPTGTAFIRNQGPTAPDYILNGPNWGTGAGFNVVCNPADATGQQCYRRFRGGGSGVDLPQSGGDGYNFAPVNYLFTPVQRIQLWSSGDYRVADFARGYYEASYVNRQTAQQLAFEPLIIGPDGEADLYVSKDNIYNPFGRGFNGDPTDPGNATNPGAVSRRLVEFGPRTTQQDLDTFRFVGGFDGNLPAPINGWTWDVFLNVGRTQGTETNTGNLNKTRLQNAIGPSMLVGGVPTCVRTAGDPTTAIDGCVPLNLFGGPGSIAQDQVGYLTYIGNERGYTQQSMFGISLTGELFSLMADRPASLAIGYENRHERGSQVPNPLVAAGLGTGNAVNPTAGGYIVNEGYAELSLPLVSNTEFAEELEVTLAARAFKYTSFGSDQTYKAGARWSPVRDITLRGTYSTAFRAPAINELYLGVQDSFEPASDPCDPANNPLPQWNCPAGAIDVGQVKARVGGNTTLKPETAKIFTAGLVVVPRWVPNLSLTVDYYNLKVDQSITTLGATTIFTGCYPAAGASAPAMCALIHRNAQGAVTSVDDTVINVGGDKVQGVDFGVRYALPSELGRFGFAFDGAYIMQWDRTVIPGWTIKAKGTYDLASSGGLAYGGALPAFKANAGVSWFLNPFGAGLTLRYIGNFKECARSDGGADGSNGGGVCTPPPGAPTPLSRNVGSYATVDGNVSYDLTSPFGKTTLALGMRNMFDRQPRIVYSGFTNNSDPGQYDFMGRFVYARLSQKF